MVVVSEIPYLSISLNRNIDCNVLCRQIGKLLEKLKETDPAISEYVMNIRFTKPIVANDSIQPKIEHKDVNISADG